MNTPVKDNFYEKAKKKVGNANIVKKSGQERCSRGRDGTTLGTRVSNAAFKTY